MNALLTGLADASVGDGLTKSNGLNFDAGGDLKVQSPTLGAEALTP